MHVSAEIPLLLFTLLGQLAVGIIIAGQCAMAGNISEPVRGKVQSQTFFAFLFICVAALLSMVHLGTPMHSPFTILHVGSSWLSREILMVMLTTAVLGGIVYLRWRKPGSKIVRPLSITACILGLFLIYAMSRVYNSPFMPGWAGASTFFLFLASSLVLGSIWQGCAVGSTQLNDDTHPAATALWRVFFLAVAGFVLLAIFLPDSIPENIPGINPDSMAASEGQVASLQGWHAMLTGLGILFFLCAMWKLMLKKSCVPMLFLALILAIGGEIVGRAAFYMSYARLGM